MRRLVLACVLLLGGCTDQILAPSGKSFEYPVEQEVARVRVDFSKVEEVPVVTGLDGEQSGVEYWLRLTLPTSYRIPLQAWMEIERRQYSFPVTIQSAGVRARVYLENASKSGRYVELRVKILEGDARHLMSVSGFFLYRVR